MTKTTLEHNFQLDRQTNMLFINVKGEYEFESMKEIILSISKYCKQNSCYKVMIDIKAMKNNINNFDRYELGVLVAETFGSFIKLTILEQKERINYFFETVVLNRFTRVKVSDDYNELITWLNED